jgi:predicted Rdx family selenoprotein
VDCAPVDASQKDLRQNLALCSSLTTWAVELSCTTLRRRDSCDLVARRSAVVIPATRSVAQRIRQLIVPERGLTNSR